MKLFHRVRSLFQKGKLDAEMTEEMRHHVELQTALNLKAGMNPDEARYAALRQFGNVAGIQEQAREQRFGIWLEQLTKDIGFAARSLNRARGFSLTVIGTLVLGIGVATVVFKLVGPAILFAPPYPQSRELFLIGYQDKNIQNGRLDPNGWGLTFLAYQEQTTVFSEYAAGRRDGANVLVAGAPVVASVVEVSRDCFHTLGIRPALGRAFLPDEYGTAANNVVVISDRFWRRHCNASPAVLGQTLLINQRPCTIVGVLKPGQAWPGYFGDRDVCLPMGRPRLDTANPLGSPLLIIGRLKPGVSAEQATAALNGVLLPELPVGMKRFFEAQRIALVPVRDLVPADKMNWVITAGGVLLYLTACLNAVNLMLVRLLGRQRELGIRLALGGARGRIVRLLVLESAGLVLSAVLLVVLAALGPFPAMLSLLTGQVNTGALSFLEWPTLGCISGLGLLAGLGLVLLPAVRLLNAEIQPSLKDGGLALGESRRLARLRGSLVVLQAAFAVILLSATGLMVRSFEKIHAVDLGINAPGLVKVQLAFPPGAEQRQEAHLQLCERLQQKLALLPGVKGVTLGEDSVLAGSFWGREEVEMTDGSFRRATGNFVAANFHQVVGLVVLRGRWFSPDRSQNEVVLNETMARAVYGDRDPLGQTFKLKAYPKLVYRVVGLVHDVRESVRNSAGLRFYAPCWWYPPLISTFMLRLEREPEEEFAGLVRHAIYEFDPGILTYGAGSVSDFVENSLRSERFVFRILKVMAGIGLGLAMVGIFSTVTYTVSCKMREFGVRLALGALPSDLHRLVLRRSLTTAALGVAVGIGGALALTRFMQSLLFETTTYDPVVHFVVAVLLLAMAAVACWLPARRAARVDPVVALRAE